MAQKRSLTRDEVLNEIFMDSDSDLSMSCDEEDTLDVDFEPEIDIEPDVNDEEEETIDVARPSTSTGRRGGGRGRGRRGQGRGRGRGTPPPADDGWTTPTPASGVLNNVPPFTETPRMLVDLNLESPNDSLGLFRQFFTDDLFEGFATETNRYAEQVRAAHPNTYYLKGWQPATAQDMKKMIALLFAMGLTTKPEMKDYWSTNSVLSTPFFRETMPRNRFFALLTFWHLNDNRLMLPREDPEHDKLFKVRPLFDVLNQKFGELYYPEQQVAVDESMVPWKGRVSFRQYIPSKPVKYGMKLYCLCESSSGYILKMKLYTGANTTAPEVGHGQQVVRDLMQGYLDVGHTVYMDSFFSNVQLFNDLLEHGTSACGTIVKNRRGLPKDLASKATKLQRGEHSVRQRGDLLAIRFHDRKDVMLISTAHTAEIIKTGKRDRRTGEDLSKPCVVDRYNQFMKGVDQLDQNLSYYAFNRKTMKWWKRMATHLLHIAKVQAYFLHKKLAQFPLTQAKFTLSPVNELLLSAANCNQQVTPPPAVPAAADSTRLSHAGNSHWPETIPSTEKKLHPTRNCKCCTLAGPSKNSYLRRKETRYLCSQCKVPLCTEPCFRIYHTHKDYKREVRRYLNID